MLWYMLKQIFLSLVLLFVLLVIVKKIPSYNSWYENKISAGFDEVAEMKEITDENERKQIRYGSVYQTYLDIKKVTDSISGNPDNVLLIPSNAYLKNANIAVELEEPSVIYYKSKLRTVLPFTHAAVRANWALIVAGNGFAFFKLDSQQKKDSLIKQYKQYP